MKQLFLLGVALALTATLKAQNSQIFAPDGKAIRGYDVVAFYTVHRPVIGQDSLAYSWQGVRWLFSTRQNLNSFQANPGRYAPQYGGYCAYGVTKGHKAPTKPETWTIVGGKLYFNYDNDVKETWLKDEQALIRQADQQWPGLKDKN